MSCIRFAVGAAGLLALSGTASAGVYFDTLFGENMFGTQRNIAIYRVATDLSSQGLTPPAGRVEPEGMTWYNGTLYVASDGSASEANGYLAAYAGGNLGSLPSGQRYTVTVGSNAAAYGPEGLTVNTRGSGYGSFSAGGSPRFTAIDSVVSPVSSRVLGAMNSGSGVVEDGVVNSAFNFDDIAYVPGASAANDRFAVVDGSTATPTLRFLTTDSTPTLTADSFALIPNAKGLLYLSAADAALFSPLATSECLLVSAGASAGFPNVNVLQLYSLDGTLIATSTITAGVGTPGIGEIESLAFDPDSKRLFLGYENGTNSQIGVVTIPTPGGAAMVAAAFFGALRRRRA